MFDHCAWETSLHWKNIFHFFPVYYSVLLKSGTRCPVGYSEWWGCLTLIHFPDFISLYIYARREVKNKDYDGKMYLNKTKMERWLMVAA